jgi:hypothetical protein
VLPQQACSAASKAYWEQADKEPNSWQLLILQAKWYMEDAWDILIRRRVPQGVTREQVVRVWFDKISESQIQQMPPALAAELFTDLPPHMVTPLIRAKLQEHDAAKESAIAATVHAAKESAIAAVTQHAQEPAASGVLVSDEPERAGDATLELEPEAASVLARDRSHVSELPQLQQDQQAQEADVAGPGAIADVTDGDVGPAAWPGEQIPVDAVLATENVPSADAEAATEDVLSADAQEATEDVLPADAQEATADVLPADAPEATEDVLAADAQEATEDVLAADAQEATEDVLPADAGALTADGLPAGQDVESGDGLFAEKDMAQPPSVQVPEIAQPAHQEQPLLEVMTDDADFEVTAKAPAEMPRDTAYQLDADVPAGAADSLTDGAHIADSHLDNSSLAGVQQADWQGLQKERHDSEHPADKPLKVAWSWSYALMVVVSLSYVIQVTGQTSGAVLQLMNTHGCICSSHRCCDSHNDQFQNCASDQCANCFLQAAGAGVVYSCCLAWFFFTHNSELLAADVGKAAEAGPDTTITAADDVPLLSDEEDERPARSRQRRQRQSGTGTSTPLAASATAAAQAVAAAVRVLTPTRRVSNCIAQKKVLLIVLCITSCFAAEEKFQAFLLASTLCMLSNITSLCCMFCCWLAGSLVSCCNASPA